MGGRLSWAPQLLWVPDCGPWPRSGELVEVGALSPDADHQVVGGHDCRVDLRVGTEELLSEASDPERESSRVRRSPIKGARSLGPNVSSR